MTENCLKELVLASQLLLHKHSFSKQKDISFFNYIYEMSLHNEISNALCDPYSALVCFHDI